jgi:general secretion pathway protein K
MTLRRRPSGFASQRGAAILTAMLTVVLVASLAASVLWQQWRAVEVEAAERTRTQAAWVLTGALDWARLILREDKGDTDHLAEPWAVPLEQARLSTFLAADRNSDALEEDATQAAFLSGQITDLQSRLNVANLIVKSTTAGKGPTVDEPSRLAFMRLFERLNLPDSELAVMVENLRLAQDSSVENQKNTAIALTPQELDQLSWVGLSDSTIEQLRPYVTVLPVSTPVNLNTASAEVIYACVPAFEMTDAVRLVRARGASHLKTTSDAATVSGNLAAKFNDAQHSVATHFFEVRGILQLDQVTVQEQSIVQRDGTEVKTLSRRRSIAPMTAPLQ